MPEVDLLRSYPKTKRQDLLETRENVSEADRKIAKQFGQDYFDGPRRLGLGGYFYHPKYFKQVVRDFADHYSLGSNCSILDVGSGKGFMLKDFRDLLPDSFLRGIDISQYCYDNCLPEIKDCLLIGSCDDLPFQDKEFDLVISIATIHNLDLEGVKRSLREIIRVSKGNSFIKVNGYKNEAEKNALFRWNLVAETILPINQWLEVFDEVGYRGDYSFFAT